MEHSEVYNCVNHSRYDLNIAHTATAAALALGIRFWQLREQLKEQCWPSYFRTEIEKDTWMSSKVRIRILSPYKAMEPILQLGIQFWKQRSTYIQAIEENLDIVFFNPETGSIDGSQGLTFDATVLALPTQAGDWTTFTLDCRRVLTMCSRNLGPLVLPRLPVELRSRLPFHPRR